MRASWPQCKLKGDMRVLFLLVMLAGAAWCGEVRGRVVDGTTKEPLARVMVEAGSVKAETDAQGRFVINTEAAELLVSTVGYPSGAHACGGGDKRIELFPQTLRRKESVTVEAGAFGAEAPLGVALEGNELKNLASVLADDPLRAAQSLPGVDVERRFQRAVDGARRGLRPGGALLRRNSASPTVQHGAGRGYERVDDGTERRSAGWDEPVCFGAAAAVQRPDGGGARHANARRGQAADSRAADGQRVERGSDGGGSVGQAGLVDRVGAAELPAIHHSAHERRSVAGVRVHGWAGATELRTDAEEQRDPRGVCRTFGSEPGYVHSEGRSQHADLQRLQRGSGVGELAGDAERVVAGDEPRGILERTVHEQQQGFESAGGRRISGMDLERRRVVGRPFCRTTRIRRAPCVVCATTVSFIATC